MVKLRCHRCGHVWDYKGQSKWYAICPNCRTTVRIRSEEKAK
jgi:predicted  nucleic acid-binding Zn-ribbon protein